MIGRSALRAARPLHQRPRMYRYRACGGDSLSWLWSTLPENRVPGVYGTLAVGCAADRQNLSSLIVPRATVEHLTGTEIRPPVSFSFCRRSLERYPQRLKHVLSRLDIVALCGHSQGDIVSFSLAQAQQYRYFEHHSDSPYVLDTLHQRRGHSQHRSIHEMSFDSKVSLGAGPTDVP